MLYPIALTVMCVMIVAGLMVYVVPKVVNVFTSSHAQLPVMTRILIAVSDFLRLRGILHPDHRRRRLFRTVALVGKSWSEAALSSVSAAPAVARQTGARLQHGALHPHPEHSHGWRPCRYWMRCAFPVRVVTNLPMRDAVAEASLRVREGASIGRSLAISKLFPPMTIHLIQSGESSGELENMLERGGRSVRSVSWMDC